MFFIKHRGFPWFFKRQVNPNKYDLRHFQWIQWSDAWDGKATAHDGWSIEVLLYQGEPVYTCGKYRVDGKWSVTTTSGNSSFVKIAEVASIYIRFAQIIWHLTGEETMEEFSPTIHMYSDEYVMLTAHPLYVELLKYTKEKGWLIRLRKNQERVYTVTALKV